MIRISQCIFFLLFFSLCPVVLSAQAVTIKGVVRDARTNETVVGATINVKGTTNGTATDIDGRFELQVDSLPQTLVISYLGFKSTELVFTDASQPVQVKLQSSEIQLKAAEVTGSRISEKQKEAPLTVESMDILAIKECPQTSFYEALGTMKGVDLTSASLGFTIVNTRGFNSTSPVRSLQLIDGVDNQSPGLNFSLGNFLGCPELDVLKVDIISGASSAYFGPNAFNGVISMTTRSPFVKPGLEVSAKVGERNLAETSFRWAQVFKNKAGLDKFAYKVNFFYMQADDWVADNMDPTPVSADGIHNPGGYDAVNRYGDEDITGANNATSISQQAQYPGLKRWYRTGYLEQDIVDYNSHNMKLGAALHYNLAPTTELIVASNFGTGTTVYQGDNRYSLKDIRFFQNRIEVRKQDKFFIRAYATNEDAGESYDAVFTAILLQESAKNDAEWSKNYRKYWIDNNIFNRAHALPGFPPFMFPYDTAQANAVLAIYNDTVQGWHNGARNYADNLSLNQFQHAYFVPGTPDFDSAFRSITSKLSFAEGGTRFYDKSALYHVHGEYKFVLSLGELTTGGNVRLYRPDSKGTIFSDTSGTKIENSEYGIYAGIESKMSHDKLKLNLTCRMDKNENFETQFSPAISLVYTIKPTQIVRISFSSAIRNPTLSDQYLYYNVGRAILLGNITGYDSLASIPSLIDYTRSPALDKTLISYYYIAPVQPEKVKTVEVGYRATLLNNIFLDANYYVSLYDDFIGYNVGARLTFDAMNPNYLSSFQVYRVAANATDRVLTQGGAIGLNWFFKKYFSLNGNYSYNILDKMGSDDPLVPAFNTPEHKFNIGFSGRDMEGLLFNKVRIDNFGFNINYKWVQGFLYEGSPQFTGPVPTYDLLDAQINYKARKLHSTFKLGASNVLNNKSYQVYGGPYIGRLAYFSVLVEIGH